MDEVLSQLGLALFCFGLYFIWSMLSEGCNKNKLDNINRIERGMTDKQVIQLLGYPDSTSNGCVKDFTYSFSGCCRKVNVYVYFDNNWKVSNIYSCERNGLY